MIECAGSRVNAVRQLHAAVSNRKKILLIAEAADEDAIGASLISANVIRVSVQGMLGAIRRVTSSDLPIEKRSSTPEAISVAMEKHAQMLASTRPDIVIVAELHAGLVPLQMALAVALAKRGVRVTIGGTRVDALNGAESASEFADLCPA